MKLDDANDNVGETVTFWDDLEDKYKEGTLIEVHEPERQCLVMCNGTEYELELAHVHLGPMDEILNSDLLEDDNDDHIDLEDDVDPDHYMDEDDDSEF